MRIQFVGTGYPSAKADNLKTILRELGIVRGIHKCQEAIAKMFGYKDWYELNTICERCTEDSPRDDAVQQTEAAERRLQYARALAAKLAINETASFAAVDKLRPTGPKIALVHSAPPKWKTLLDAGAHRIGGMFFPPSHNLVDRGIPSKFANFAAGQTRGGEAVLSDGLGLRYWVSPNTAGASWAKIRRVDALLMKGRTPVGTIEGFLIEWPERQITADDFVADGRAANEGADALGLVETYGIKVLQAAGSILVVQHWETARGKVASGTGIHFLRALLREMKSISPALGAIAADLYPSQFLGLPLDDVPQADVDEAYASLKRHWDRNSPREAIGPNGSWLPYDGVEDPGNLPSVRHGALAERREQATPVTGRSGIAVYLVTDQGPIALRKEDSFDLDDLNGDLAIPSLSGQTVRSLEVFWNDDGGAAPVLRCRGFYRCFNADGRYDSSHMTRGVDLAMAASPSKRAEYQRQHTWTVDPSAPFMSDVMLDIRVRAKMRGGKRLPTVSKVAVRVGRSKSA